MGYALFDDQEALAAGVTRWAGYGVPAVCDHPDCTVEICRGMDWKCHVAPSYRYLRDGIEVTADDDWDEELEVDPTEDGGCGMFFCSTHQPHDIHLDATAKPDTAEWEDHILSDEAWTQWRQENTARVSEMRSRRQPSQEPVSAP